MQVKAINEDPYAPTATFKGWAREAYEDQWHRNVPNRPLEPAPPELCGVVSHLLEALYVA